MRYFDVRLSQDEVDELVNALSFALERSIDSTDETKELLKRLLAIDAEKAP